MALSSDRMGKMKEIALLQKTKYSIILHGFSGARLISDLFLKRVRR